MMESQQKEEAVPYVLQYVNGIRSYPYDREEDARAAAEAWAEEHLDGQPGWIGHSLMLYEPLNQRGFQAGREVLTVTETQPKEDAPTCP